MPVSRHLFAWPDNLQPGPCKPMPSANVSSRITFEATALPNPVLQKHILFNN